MLRVIKYVRRGYTIQVTSLGAVIARLAMAVKPEKLGDAEGRWGFVIAGLLREVDPALVVDGLEGVNDPETEEGAGCVPRWEGQRVGKGGCRRWKFGGGYEEEKKK